MNDLYKKSQECIKSLQDENHSLTKIVLTLEEWEAFDSWAKDLTQTPDTLESLCALLLCSVASPNDLSSAIERLLHHIIENDHQLGKWGPFLLGAGQNHIINFYQKQNKRIPFSFIKTLGTIMHKGNWEMRISVMEFLDLIGPQALILRPEIEKIKWSWTFPWQKDKRKVRQEVRRWLQKWKIPKGV
ncbi:MAG: hypothetical protein QE271_12770 [Bacteriovoracaceae bacterium]|nr:hypothetical protein [Bacteriovoracaceae bacterium]